MVSLVCDLVGLVVVVAWLWRWWESNDWLDWCSSECDEVMRGGWLVLV